MSRSFIFLLIFTIIIIGRAYSQAGKIVADKIIAVIGDKIILDSDIKNSIWDMKRNDQMPPVNAYCYLSDNAIISKLMVLQAEKDSLTVADEEVEAELDHRVNYVIRKYGTKEQVELVANKTIYQIKADAWEQVKESKLAATLQRKLFNSVSVSPSEVKTYFDKISKDSLPFFESELEIGQIIAYPRASRDFEKYMVDELNNYRRQIERGIAGFEQLARRYSEDPESRERGGLYELNRNDKTWDPAFIMAAYRLKPGQLSPVVKTKMGFHIIYLEERSGDEMRIRHILRIPPVTQTETNLAIAKLDSVRAKIISGRITFNEAASKYSEAESQIYQGAFLLNTNGGTNVSIDQLDSDIVALVSKLQPGGYSTPTPFTDKMTGKKGIRFIFLKSRTDPHQMNMKDDYYKIAQMVLEEKKLMIFEKWMKENLRRYFISIDHDVRENCPVLSRFVSSTTLN